MLSVVLAVSIRWEVGMKQPLFRFGFITVFALGFMAHGFAAGRTLRCGWYAWPPYQYTETRQDIEVLTGLDVQLVRGILGRSGYTIHYQPVSWEQHQRDLRSGVLDIATGATFTPEREAYAFFSEPYRVERNVLYVRQEDGRRFSFANIPAVLQAVGDGSFRLGIVSGFAHASPAIRRFLVDPGQRARLVSSADDLENFQKLAHRVVDGILCDRLVGIHLTSAAGLTVPIAECPLDLGSVPIHVMFSRKTCTEADVAAFNRGLAAFRTSGRYRDNLRSYMLPLLIAQSTNQPWFLFLEIVGTVAFAISGILLARKERYNIVGALLLAALPALGGGLVRDLITGRQPVGMLRSPVYILIVSGVVLAGYVTFFVWDRLSTRWDIRIQVQSLSSRIAQHLFQVSDTLGLAAFTVVGIGVALEMRVQPIWLWGPLLAAVTGAGGSILRDIVRADYYHPALKSSIYAEIPIVWGALLVFFFEWESERLVPAEIRLGVLATVLGAFACRLYVIYAPIKRYFLYAPYAYDPAVKLQAIFKLETEMVERLPRYVSGLLAAENSKGGEEVELIHSLTRKSQVRIMEALGALSTERLEPAYIAELLRLQQRASLLAVLSNDIYDLVHESDAAQQSANLTALIDHLLNALHAVLSQAVEALRAVDASDIDILIVLTDDRSEMMRRLREQYQASDLPLSRSEARCLWRLTTIFDRAIWVLRQYGSLLRQGRPA